MNQEQLEKYGNEYTISGIIVGNGNAQQLIVFPGESLTNDAVLFEPTAQELQEIFTQLDTLQISGIQKIVLRKSQRNIEQGVSWAVFRRDGYSCFLGGFS